VLKMVANLLVESFARRTELFPGALGNLLVDGESNVNLHSICAHILCVKF